MAINWRTRRIAFNHYVPNSALQLWTAGLDNSSAEAVLQQGFNGMPEWSPDGTQLSFLSYQERSAKIITLKSRAIKVIGPSICPAIWCPDGRSFGLVEVLEQAATYRLSVVSLVDGSRRTLASTVVTNVPGNLFYNFGLRFDWSPDGREVIWPRLENGRGRLVLIDVQTDQVKSVLPTPGSAYDPCFSPDGRWIAYSTEDTGHSHGIRVLSVEGTEDHAITTQTQFIKGESVYYPSSGGIKIPSFLFRPAGTKGKAPAVVWLHGGGGISAALDELDPAIQYFAVNGFVVLEPNFRSSRGFGPELVTHVTGVEIAEDAAAAADFLRTLPEVDAGRIAVLGASFGGYAVLRTITSKPNAFAAAVDVNGPCDLAALYRKAPMHRPLLTAMLGGTPESAADRYRQESPINEAQRSTTPLLVIHGTADEVVPYAQTKELVKAMQKAGKPCKLLTYEGVGHGFPGKLWANVMQQSLVFLREQLKIPLKAGAQGERGA